MRYSGLFGKTVREDHHGIRLAGYALLQKGRYVRRLGQGLFAFLPLGLKVLENLQRIISEEMAAIGGQEIYTPVVTPAENNFFPKTYKAYKRVFHCCGIETVAAAEGGGHAFIACDKCQYRASKEVAIGGKEYLRGKPLELEKALTPSRTTMDALCAHLGLTRDEDLAAVGLIPGYLSSIGLNRGVRTVVDGAVARSANHDEHGILWPAPLAPHKAYLPGIPVRIVVSAKHLAQGVVDIQERRIGRLTLVSPAQVERSVADMTGGTR